MAQTQPQIQNVASGFLHRFVSQVATRLITFSVNLIIARQLSPELYGVSAVQFHLVTTTILLLSREGFRRGCLRVSSGGPGKDKPAVPQEVRVLALAWLVLPLGALVTAGVCALTLRGSSSQDAAYVQGVIIHGAAALVELASEPLYILASTQLQFKRQSLLETAATLARALASLGLLAGGQHAFLAFSYAQLAYAVVLLLGYCMLGLGTLRQSVSAAARHRWDAQDREVLTMVGWFSLQSAEKLVLAEGSKVVLVAVESSRVAGEYALVSNLGSLLVRTLLQPLEDVAFTAFSRAGVAVQGKDDKARLMSQLRLLLRCVTLLGLLVAAFGPAYSYTLLRLMYGPRWSDTDAPQVLGYYCGYVLVLAVNGVSEAFVHAVLDQRGLQANNLLLLAFSGAHMAATWVLVRQAGAVGLVLADAVNMLLRIAYSAWYIRRYFTGVQGSSLRALVPGTTTLVATAAALGLTLASESALMAGAATASTMSAFVSKAAAHVGLGVLMLAVWLAAVYRSEGEVLRQALRLRRRKEE